MCPLTSQCLSSAYQLGLILVTAIGSYSQFIDALVQVKVKNLTANLQFFVFRQQLDLVSAQLLQNCLLDFKVHLHVEAWN